MKVAIVNQTKEGGGAAVASKELYLALKATGLDMKFLSSEDFASKYRMLFNLALEKLYFLNFEASSKTRFQFSFPVNGIKIAKHLLNYDIIHLNWINQGFLSFKELERILNSGKPVVWTMHDMWPFTGGCHYSHGCEHFLQQCGNCPFLRQKTPNDLSFKEWSIKSKIYKTKNLRLVTVSDWQRNLALSSSLFSDRRIVTIPNVIDINHYSPRSKELSREKLNLEKDRIYILFGANRIDDPIKGLSLLLESLERIHNKRMTLVLFGKEPKYQRDILLNRNIEIKYFSVIDKATKPILYSACDMTCVPSFYETFGLVAAESLSCGTPVIAFNNSGTAEVVDHKSNGYLADFKSVPDFTEGIQWILSQNKEQLKTNAREKVLTSYSPEIVAKKYLELYKEIFPY